MKLPDSKKHIGTSQFLSCLTLYLSTLQILSFLQHCEIGLRLRYAWPHQFLLPARLRKLIVLDGVVNSLLM
jgi:hypothetical protein